MEEKVKPERRRLVPNGETIEMLDGDAMLPVKPEQEDWRDARRNSITNCIIAHTLTRQARRQRPFRDVTVEEWVGWGGEVRWNVIYNPEWLGDRVVLRRYIPSSRLREFIRHYDGDVIVGETQLYANPPEGGKTIEGKRKAAQERRIAKA